MLKVRSISRSYGDFMAVSDVSFNIGKGEIVGLLGHNGAGKTTVMKVLSGYLEPNQGKITVNSINLSANPKFVQKNLGYLPENLPIYPEMSVADYLDYASNLKGLTFPRNRSEISRVIRATSLGAKLLDPISTLSRGYRQRVGVAQAILGKPKLLILDEPTNGLDPTQTEHMRQLIRDIAKDATVILSTHIMQEVEALCDRVLILNRGSLAVDARLDKLRQSNSILLSTSMPEDKVQSLLNIKGLDKIICISKDTSNPLPIYHYRLTFSGTDTVNSASAVIAKTIVTKEKFDLFSLQPEHLDLETLFREVSGAQTALFDVNNKKSELNVAA
jgi:ABC-2 type transport system ATP-binding protein